MLYAGITIAVMGGVAMGVWFERRHRRVLERELKAMRAILASTVVSNELE